jgi:hypothetical protein
MSAAEFANPTAGPAFHAARPEPLLLTIVVPMYNEADSAADESPDP